MIARVDGAVAVLRAGADDLEEIAELGGVAITRLPDQYLRVVGDARLLDELDDEAQAFLARWHARGAA